jgi:glutathione S-transferase
MRLITIPLSHYCERARWALDYCQIPYTEDQHLQMFHRRHVRQAGGRHTVPVLVTAERALGDSADIVAYADGHAPAARRLYPADQAARSGILHLEGGYADELGVEVRRWCYLRLLPYRRLLLRYNGGNAPWRERAALQLGFPFARRTVVRYLGITAERVERGLDQIARHLDEAAARLADGRPYLTGDDFTAADLTFASLASLLVMPDEYGVPLPTLAELPAELAAEIRGFQAHPAGAFVLRLYRDHRRVAELPRS